SPDFILFVPDTFGTSGSRCSCATSRCDSTSCLDFGCSRGYIMRYYVRACKKLWFERIWSYIICCRSNLERRDAVLWYFSTTNPRNLCCAIPRNIAICVCCGGIWNNDNWCTSYQETYTKPWESGG